MTGSYEEGYPKIVSNSPSAMLPLRKGCPATSLSPPVFSVMSSTSML